MDGVASLIFFKLHEGRDLSVEMMEDEWEKSTGQGFSHQTLQSAPQAPSIRIDAKNQCGLYSHHCGLCGLARLCTEVQNQELTVPKKIPSITKLNKTCHLNAHNNFRWSKQQCKQQLNKIYVIGNTELKKLKRSDGKNYKLGFYCF